MVSFFPTPYPDELLYSVIARYHIRSGNNSPKATLSDLFNSTTVTAVVELPSNINRLISNLPVGSMFNAEELVYKHTMLPYFTAFVTVDRAKRIYDYMLSDNGSKIYSELGLGNSYIKLNTYLRFCPECVEEDIKVYGETYWHRIHQVPGLNFCIKHKKLLHNSTAAMRLKNRQEYVNAMMELCMDRDNKNFKPVEVISMYNNEEDACSRFEDIKNKTLIIGGNIGYLLNNEVEFKELNLFKEVYTHKLIESNLASRRDGVYQYELLAKFKCFWGESFLEVLNCNFDVDKTSNWVSTITRKHRKGFHPIQHILFIEFLGVNIEAIFATKVISEVKRKQYQAKKEDEIIGQRNKWIELMQKHPNKSKSFLANIDRAVHTWLYRHDNDWLKENSPKKKKGNRNDQLIDWEERDQEILILVKGVIEELRNSEDKPERISSTLVAKKINKVTLIQRHLDRLPNAREFLHNNLESLEDFQMRRVKWAIMELAKEGEVKEWNVIIKAGLNKFFYDKHMTIIKELIFKNICEIIINYNIAKCDN